MSKTRVFLILALIGLLILSPTAQARTLGSGIKLTPYEHNPIMTADETLAWEAGGIGRQRIISHEGTLYMFYQGYNAVQTRGAVGYATSTDGIHWTKYKNNPVFVPEKEVAWNGVMNIAVVLKGETWILYFTPWAPGRLWYQFTGDILIATASSPNGPWTVGTEPALAESKAPNWDAGGRYLQTVTLTNDGYAMFYDAGGVTETGMATSPDGLHWKQYDDATTTDSRHTASDPVFGHSQDSRAWDGGYISGALVRMTEVGWEMFYSGGDALITTRSIGYATSPDGIHWTRIGESPVLADESMLLAPESVVEFNGHDYLYYVMLNKSYKPLGIGLARVDYE